MRKRSPVLASALILFLGPVGFLYVGWRYALLALIVLIFFASVLTVVGFPLPAWIKYFILPALAYKGYKIASFRNELLSNADSDVRYLNTFYGAIIGMSDVLTLISVVYCVAIGIFVAIQMLLAGRTFSGLIFLFFATPILTAIAYFVFGFISNSISAAASEALAYKIQKERDSNI